MRRFIGSIAAAIAAGVLFGLLVLRTRASVEEPIDRSSNQAPVQSGSAAPDNTLERSLQEDLQEKLRRLAEARAVGKPAPKHPNPPLAGRHFLEAWLKSWRGSECRRLQKELSLSDEQRIRIEEIVLSSTVAVWHEVYAERLEFDALLRAAEAERAFPGKVSGVLTESQRGEFGKRWDPHWHILTPDRPEAVGDFLAQTDLDDAERANAMDDIRTYFIAEELLSTRAHEMRDHAGDNERRLQALLGWTVERLKSKISPGKLPGLQKQLRREER